MTPKSLDYGISIVGGDNLMSYDWLKDDYANEWLNRISENTRNQYKATFPKWLAFIGMSPKEQILRRIKDLQSSNPKERGFFEDRVIEYGRMLATQNYKKNTIHNMVTPIQSFFSSHRVKLSFRKGDLNFKTQKSEKVIEKFAPTNEEIRAMYSLANVRDRSLILVLYQSGFSSIDTISLNIENIKGIYDLNDHYFIQQHRQKTDSIQATCISAEAIHDIKAMLRERGSPKQGALFITPKGERLSTRFLNDAMKKLAKKSLPTERAKEFQTKSLRDAYNSALLEANLTQEVKDLLFGHKRTGAKSHYAYNENVIRNAYEKAFKFLTINHGTQARKDLERIETSLVGLSKTVAKQQETITEQNIEMKKLADQMHRLLSSLEGNGLVYTQLRNGKETGYFLVKSEEIDKETADKLQEEEDQEENS